MLLQDRKKWTSSNPKSAATVISYMGWFSRRDIGNQHLMAVTAQPILAIFLTLPVTLAAMFAVCIKVDALTVAASSSPFALITTLSAVSRISLKILALAPAATTVLTTTLTTGATVTVIPPKVLARTIATSGPPIALIVTLPTMLVVGQLIDALAVAA